MKNFLILIALFLVTISKINAQAFEWYKRYPTEAFAGDIDNRVSVDANSSSIVYAGFFKDSIRIGSHLFLHNSGTWPNSKYGGYLVKYDQTGALTWTKQIKGGAISNLNAKLDQAQNIFVSGIFKDSLRYNTTAFISPGYNIFILKVNSNGDVLWAKKSSSPTSIPAPMIMQTRHLKSGIDIAGNFYLTGTYSDAIQFENITLNTNGNIGGLYLGNFMLKYDGNGNLQWFKNTLTVDGQNTDLAVTKQDGFYYVSGGFNTFSVLRKFDPNGILLWAKNLPASNLGGLSIGVDESDNAYLAAYYTAPFNSGGLQLPLNNSGPFKSAYYFAKINKNGDWKWVNEIVLGYPQNMSGLIKLTGKIYKDFTITGGTPPNLQLGDSTYSQPGIFAAKYDTLGTLLQSRQFRTTNSGNQALEALATDPLGNTYFVGSFMQELRLGHFLLNTIGFTPITRYLTKLQNYSNALTGTVYRDSNSNGIKEAGESPLSERILEITPGPIYVNTLANGDFGTFLPADTFSISMPNPPRHYTVAPISHNFTFSGVNQSIAGKDFAVQPIPNMNDAKINITPYSAARPGRTLIYRLTYSNVGTTVLSDSISLNFNSTILTYDSSSVTPTTQKTGQLNWYYQNLQPNEKRSINVYLFVDSTSTLGTPLQALAAIKPFASDQFIQDNYDTLNHVVSTSFDPNDKQVNRSFLTPAQISDQPYLDYTIRFQNTGTDTAFTVIIRDEFSSKLYVPSFELLSASHPYKFRLLENGMAEWRFDNILLPDSNRNEPASHGFIRYRMKPKNNLVLGDEIKSRAAIYFDYNSPVLTNYAVTKISLTNGIKEKNTNIQAFRLYPNPAKNYVMVEAEFKKNTPATVSLVNLLGQTLSSVKLPANNQIHYQLPLNELPKGVYLIRLQTETGMQTKRLVIQ